VVGGEIGRDGLGREGVGAGITEPQGPRAGRAGGGLSAGHGHGAWVVVMCGGAVAGTTYDISAFEARGTPGCSSTAGQQAAAGGWRGASAGGEDPPVRAK
jgi:hypothetical protein